MEESEWSLTYKVLFCPSQYHFCFTNKKEYFSNGVREDVLSQYA